ncbi:hypothetical protein [Klebsiella pneumoniae]|uniref:hypothetical protein n=1 Tax=Klebsiella pneumoniae TaxID=573 RepID=UPI002B40002F|nr:hypothetical protein [Klebsiella pneumoniae]
MWRKFRWRAAEPDGKSDSGSGSHPGPSLIIAYSPCEEHGYDLALSHDQMRQLTATGFWPLYRFDPRRADEGKIPGARFVRHQTRWPRRCLMSNVSAA